MAGHHHHHHNATGNLKLAFFINLAFATIKLIGGFFTNSIAIISHALHDYGDNFSLSLVPGIRLKRKELFAG